MTEQLLRLDLMNGVVDVPEPQIGLRQSLMQGLGARHRDQALLVGASEEDANPQQLCSFVIPGCAEGTDPESRAAISGTTTQFRFA